MISLTTKQAQALLTDKGFALIDKALTTSGTRLITDNLQLSVVDNIIDPAVAAGAILYFEEQCPYVIDSILNPYAIRAFELLMRNYPVEADAAKATLAQRLSTKADTVKLIVSFGLFGSLLNIAEETADNDCILTPAAMMLIREQVPDDPSALFDLFQAYIDSESELSYGTIMVFVRDMLNAHDLKFSHVYHARALPIFVQMMRNIPVTEYADLDMRFKQWLLANVPNDKHAEFATVAVGALQVFYRQMLEKSDWPN